VGNNGPVPTQTDLILRLLLAAALGGLLGGERELTEQPAGFRTHILVALGAALFAIVSAFGFQAIAGLGPPEVVRADLTRIASQIVVGIGFLGGGAILKYGISVRGLTTAASLWVTAAVGTAIGIGELVLGAVTAGTSLVALVGLRPLRRVLRRHAGDRDEYLIDARASLDIAQMLHRLRSAGATILELQVSEEGADRAIRLVARPAEKGRAADLVADIAADPNVRNVDWIR
jgi:putative Mg2+ transporter-C (MgtC) family protein